MIPNIFEVVERQAIQKGREEGREKGRKEGREEGRREILRELSKMLSPAEISKLLASLRLNQTEKES